MKSSLKTAGLAALALGAAAIGGAASAYPVFVPAPYPAPVYAPPVAYAPPYAYVRPAWVGGIYYGYPYYWHGVRYFGPHGFHYGYRRWR